MTLYNALHRNSQIKDCKIDLLTQQYEKFLISSEEAIDSGFTRFNAFVTSLKSLDQEYSSKNHVRKRLHCANIGSNNLRKIELELKAAEVEIHRMDQRYKDEALYLSTNDEELKAVLKARVFPNKIGFIITNLDIIGVIEDEEMFAKLSDDDAIRICFLLAVEVMVMKRCVKLMRSFEVFISYTWLFWTANISPGVGLDELRFLIYYMEGHNLHFGHREFSLITGLRFGTVSFDLHSSGELKFRNRVFPNKLGFIVTNLDIISLIGDEEIFGNLSDDDAIRLCLLLALEIIFMRRLLTFNMDDTLHGDEHYYGLFKDRNHVPTYTLSGFVFAFQESRSTSDLRPTIAEYQSSWWIDNNVYFQEHVPRAPPIKEHHSLFETYLAKLEKARKRGKTGFMVSSIGGTSDNSVKKKWLNDLVIMELNYRVFKLETIIQDYLRKEELRLCLEDEEMLRSPAKRNKLGSSSEKINSKVSWVKIKKDRQHVNDPCTAKLLKNVKPWVEDISRVLHCMDTVWLSDDIERFLGQPGQVKCKFPWNDDYTVDRNFWLKLVCLDPTRKGWLTEELLLQKGLPLFYANGERYTAPWSEVDQVFIPINETGEHWWLAEFHILSGDVTFYDTGYAYDCDYHDWYVKERHEQILELQSLVGSNVAIESVRLLNEFQYDDLQSTRGMMRLICETQLKVLKKISFIALLRRQ
ncbi:phospholipase-like protein [Tanacetum coccineum]